MGKQMNKVAEIRNPKGEVLWTVWLSPAKLGLFRAEGKSAEDKPQAPEEGEKAAGQGEALSDDPMTEAQRRYLFRLLSDQGIEGDAAYQHLKEAFGVESLSEVSKYDASRAIDQLLNK